MNIKHHSTTVVSTSDLAARVASSTITVRRLRRKAASLFSRLVILGLVIAAPSMRAQFPVFGGVKRFGVITDGLTPGGTLIQDGGGNFYGTTQKGGAHGSGVVFKISPAGVVTSLHDFNVTIGTGANVDGAHPFGGLVTGTDNNYYGTTRDGGTNGTGTVFRITPGGILTTIYSFAAIDANGFNGDGANPEAALLLGGDGDFYGTAFNGGTNGQGSVFKVSSGGSFTPLFSFSALDGSGLNKYGANPEAALVRSGNIFYGTTERGGNVGSGVVFAMSSVGQIIVVHHFGSSGNNDGSSPFASLVLGSDSNLYGTTRYGGDHGSGTVFKMTANGTVTILHSFSELMDFSTNGDGGFPQSALVQGSDGSFYGTADFGGVNGSGTVFKITSAGTFTLLHTFGVENGYLENGDGGQPQSALIQGGDGNFYGLTSAGGVSGSGTAYRMTPAGAVTSLHSFASVSTDGALPEAGLVLGGDGNFYGTTSVGGVEGVGTVFKLTPARVLTVVHSFSAVAGEGTGPVCALTQGNDGSLYGTTTAGGTTGNGTVFKVTTGGALTTLHHFSALDGNGINADGSRPYTGLVHGTDGNFYGVTVAGGAHKGGTVFKITPAGMLTTLHVFSATDAQGNNSDGAAPLGALIQATDGSFYGTASSGGVNHTGTVYAVTASGIFTALCSFDGADANGHNVHGALPFSGLTQGSDGNFYGTTYAGGNGGEGTIFQVTSAGALTTVHTFSLRDGNGDNSDGAQLGLAPLLLAGDGSFYGTASVGGANGQGTVFRVTSAGAFTTLHSFGAIDSGNTNGDGATPAAGLAVGGDGNFYGTTGYGGVNGTGKIYVLTFAPVVTSAASAGAVSGQPFTYQITASHRPTAFGVLGLLPGLTVNAKTGLISGTTAATGVHKLTLKVANNGGSDTATLTLTIQQPVPVINSPAAASATKGQAFSYQITASNHPTHFGVLSLPPGLHVNAATGFISGTPTTSGGKTLTLQATNTSGTGTASLHLTIAP